MFPDCDECGKRVPPFDEGWIWVEVRHCKGTPPPGSIVPFCKKLKDLFFHTDCYEKWLKRKSK